MIALFKRINDFFSEFIIFPTLFILFFGLIPFLISFTYSNQPPSVEPKPTVCTEDVVILKDNSVVTIQNCNGVISVKEGDSK